MFRRFGVILKLSWKNLTASKARTFLTILGIIIGIAAVMIVMSVGTSAQSLILDQVRNVGSNLIIVLPGASKEDGPPAAAFGVVTTSLKNSDLEAMRNKRNVPHLAVATGYAQGTALASYKDQGYQITYQGVTSEFLSVESASIESGRFFTSEEDASMERIAVLGATRARDFFGTDDPLGKTLKIGELRFRIIGVMKERGSVAFGSPDKTVYVPLLTAQNLLLGSNYLSFVRATVDEEANIESTKEGIRSLLRDRHDITSEDADDFSVRSADSALNILKQVTDILKYFLVSVASVSLFVGGIGIMNIMLISMKQRIREIGLRKALGAINRDIVTQFIIESIFISFVGTAFGVVIGILVTWICAMVIQYLGYNWEFIVTFDSVFLAFLLSLVIGIVFGIYPARKAAQVSPTEALRYE